MSGFTEKAKDLADDAKDKASDIVGKIDEKIPDSVREKISTITSKIEEKIPESVKDKVGSLTEKVKDLIPGNDPADKVREKLGDSVDTGASIAADVKAEFGKDVK